MRLNRVIIKNFRSIKDCEVTFDPPCRVLVGINEAGKSNILNALALLSEDYRPVSGDDSREPSPSGDDPINESSVRFIFKFDKVESDKLFKNISAKIAADTKNPKIVTDGENEYTLKEFCTTRDEGIYQVNILNEKKTFASWIFPKAVQLLGEWSKPSEACPATYVFESEGKEYQLAQYSLVNAADFNEVPETHLENATIDDFASVVHESIREITKVNVPNAQFWKFEESNILPSSIEIADFTNNPDSCVPLRNMFLLAGYEDIKTVIEEERKGTPNQCQNFFDRVANRTTAHFRSVWKDYRNITFTLKLNADQIIPGIKELNSFDFARRSDGFKRFVTFY